MTVPTYDKFIEPLLRFLASRPEGVAANVAHEYAASALELTDEDKQELLPSGAQLIYKNRVGWAHDRLKRAGLSSSPKRGFWKITPDGIEFCNTHSTPFTNALVENLAMGFINVRLKEKPDSPSLWPEKSAQTLNEISKASPEERLDQALRELRETTEADLLEQLANVSPSFFETIVLDLLLKMGYGANRSDLQKVGGVGDGGIDGIISLDRLGLEKVYVQAKRWQGSIGRPDLQAFYGALAGQKAKKGVFITTSSFTTQALDFAKSVDGIVLIDGTKLAGFMIDFELGVSSKTVKIPKIDGDYFDESLV